MVGAHPWERVVGHCSCRHFWSPHKKELWFPEPSLLNQEGRKLPWTDCCEAWAHSSSATGSHVHLGPPL